MTERSPAPGPAISTRRLRLTGIVSAGVLLVTLVAAVLIVNAQKPSNIAVAGPQDSAQTQLGEQIFSQGVEGAAACSLCHTLNGTALVGPSLQHIAITAAARVPGQTAQDYIRSSILNPNAYKVAGFETGTMSPSYVDLLTEEDTAALVAFLMTQD
jgi:mono/diheme cytochrome c family protein